MSDSLKTTARSSVNRKAGPISLSPEQWDRVMSIHRLLILLSRRWTPQSLRKCDQAVAETFDVLLHRAMVSAITFDPRRGTAFTTYFGFWAREKVRIHWRQKLVPLRSLDDVVCDRTGCRRIETVRDAKAGDPATGLDYEHVTESMRHLVPREREALEWCYGLNGRPKLTSGEAARFMGVSGQRVRQLCDQARQRLFDRLRREEGNE